MQYPDEICIRLFSSIFPCPWEDILPDIKSAREQLETDFSGPSQSLPDDLKEVLLFCRECPGFDPVSVYLRKNNATESVQGTS